jgi:enamine deaminase RidA (YjgF/YER057c/UK114 family)
VNPNPDPGASPAADPPPSRRHYDSGSTFEREIGYSRAVRDGEWVFVSGTTGFDYTTMTIAGDIAAQATQCLANIDQALHALGSELAHVVRVIYVIAPGADFSAAWPVLRRAWAGILPAAMMISAGMSDPRMLIEIQATARIPNGAPTPERSPD